MFLDVKTTNFNVLFHTIKTLIVRLKLSTYRRRPALFRPKNIRPQMTPDHNVIAIRPIRFQTQIWNGTILSPFDQSTIPPFMKTGVNSNPTMPPP